MLSKKELKTACFTKTGKFKRTTNIIKNKEITNSLSEYFSGSKSIYEYLYRLKNDIDEIPVCPVCGKQLKYLRSKNRYQHHCCPSCARRDKETAKKLKKTCLEKYGDENYRNTDKARETCLRKYGVSSYLKTEEFKAKSKATRLEKYGDENYSNPEKTNETCIKRYGSCRNYAKIKETMQKRYGVSSFLSSNVINKMRNSPEIQAKIQKTKRKNHTFNTSKDESKDYELLVEKFGKEDVIAQYKSKEYPFNCDFYIKSIDTYIECNYFWMHGKHPYNPNSSDDLKILEKWKAGSKSKKAYSIAITTWTIRDVKKIETAKKNNLRYKTFYTNVDFKNWLNSI